MNFTSYAQNFEDVMLWRALHHIPNGRYVDIGAQHPVLESVSKGFYEQGWRGVHVEPVPKYAEMLRNDRPDETVLQTALGAEAGIAELNVIPDTGLSTLVETFAQRHQSRHGFESHKLRVPILPLRTALAFLADQEVHWLKIDVEGWEEAVLEGWDAQTLRPWIILIEATEPSTQTLNYFGAERILLEAGYRFAYFDGLSRFYVSQEHLDLLPAFSAPPNVFDPIQLSEHSHLLREVVARYVVNAKLQAAELAQAQSEVAAARRDCDRLLGEVAKWRSLAHQAQSQIPSLEARVQAMDERMAAETARLHAVLGSTSWKISAPVRVVGAPFRRVVSAVRERRVASGLKRRIKPIMARGARFVVKHPRLNRVVVATLDLHPPLRQRIHDALTPPVGSPEGAPKAQPWRALTMDDLPVDAQKIYLALKATANKATD